jgi:hypothetical protein
MTPRTNDVRNAMLLWLSLHGDRQPNPEEFTSSKESVVTGIRASTEETLTAVRNLAAHSLVTGVPVNELDYPLRIHLTDFRPNCCRRP